MCQREHVTENGGGGQLGQGGRYLVTENEGGGRNCTILWLPSYGLSLAFFGSPFQGSVPLWVRVRIVFCVF